VIAVMMRHESDVEFPSELLCSDGRREDFFIHAEIQIGADQEVARLNQPTRIADPPNRDAAVMRAYFVENRLGRLDRLWRRNNGSHHRNRQ
jgi:hypothetical protein